MPSFQCAKCNYELEKEEAPEQCPYCGKKDTIKPYKTAQSFLDESEL